MLPNFRSHTNNLIIYFVVLEHSHNHHNTPHHTHTHLHAHHTTPHHKQYSCVVFFMLKKLPHIPFLVPCHPRPLLSLYVRPGIIIIVPLLRLTLVRKESTGTLHTRDKDIAISTFLLAGGASNRMRKSCVWEWV